MKRASGILLPVFSLPGEYSCGSFGRNAYDFIDFLKAGGFTYWQILPLCIPDSYNSPYSSYSSFLGNPACIDLDMLKADGLLTEEELKLCLQSSPYICEYERLGAERMSLLKKAAGRLGDRTPVLDFIREHPEIGRGCRFMALKEANAGASWNKWTVSEPDPEEIFAWEFSQYAFMKQWDRLHEYASSQGIKIIGDLPFYVSYDSCDVWADRKQFRLSGDLSPESVAGVPPDYFSEDGQLWGNPLYNWEEMEKDGFGWWISRVGHMLKMFDGVRIDHFRAISRYWSVPYGSPNARAGKWEKGPGKAFIDALKEAFGSSLIIAENLGIIDSGVNEILEYSKFPGMAVFQFAFDGNPDNTHLPHNYEKNLVAYTGTHDNNTLLGFMWELSSETRAQVLEYIGFSGDDWNKSYESILRILMRSTAETVIFQLQDILGYGADTRINTPGTVGKNWQFRVTAEQLRSADREKYSRMNHIYGRDPG